MIQDLKFDHKNAVHYLDALPKDIDVGSYIFSFEVRISFSYLIKICFLSRFKFAQFYLCIALDDIVGFASWFRS